MQAGHSPDRSPVMNSGQREGKAKSMAELTLDQKRALAIADAEQRLRRGTPFAQEKLESALRNADAAGDVDAARKLANELKATRNAPAASSGPDGGPWLKYQSGPVVRREQQRAIEDAQSRIIDGDGQSKFRITAPDGRVFMVTGDNEQGALDALRQHLGNDSGSGPWTKYKPDQDGGWGQTFADIGRSAMSGVRSGVEGIAGMAGDVRQMQGDIAGWAAGKMGASPEMQDSARAVASRFSPLPFSPSSEQVKNLTTMAIGEHYQPQSVPGEYARTVGEFLPATAIPAGKAGFVSRFATQTMLPALASESAGQLTEGTAAEPYARIAGALMAPLATSAIRRAVTPLPIDANRKKLVDALTREGVDLTAGQKSGRQSLRYAESELGGGAAANFMERQGDQFTSAVLSRAGIRANRATPDVIDDAFSRIGQQFDDLAARNTLRPDRQLGNDLASTVQEYFHMTPASARAPIIEKITRDIAASVRGGLDGAAYQAVRSRLDKAARAARTDPQLQEALFGIRNSLDDAMERSIAAANPGDSGAWQEARRQWKNMLVIEKAATGAGEYAAQGIISPSQLRNAVVQQSRRAYARGNGDFADLARAGEAIMKPLPQSGTAPRMAARNLGTGVTSILGAGAGASAGGPMGAAAGAAAGAVVPYAAGRAMLSGPGRAYLGNQLVSGEIADPRVAAVVNALLASRGERGTQPALPAR